MKFKTTIKLVVDACDKNEAVEIAGEYLSGNITTGVDMKFSTISIRRKRQVLACFIMGVFIAGICVIRLYDTKHTDAFIPDLSGDSALQSPLKTSDYYSSLPEFKLQWQSKQAEEILNFVKK